MVLRRGDQAGNDQLPHLQAGAGRALLREDLRPDHRLGMPLRQVQADEAPRRRLRQVRRRGDQVQGAPRADGPHRARLARLARLVLQGPAVADRAPARHLAARPRADPLLRVVRRHRSRRDGAEGEGAPLRGALPRAARRARRRVRRPHGRRRDQGAPAARRRRHAVGRAPHDHEDGDVADQAPEGRQAPEGVRRVPPLGPPARVDDPRRHPGDSAGAAAPRAPGRRPVRDLRPERPLPPRHQPEQPAEEAPRAARAGSHRAQREAHAPGGGGRPVRQRPPRPRAQGLQQPAAEVALGHAQGQAGPVPSEPARQARRLLRPLGRRRRARS